jgi:arylsulfatase A-like enzyme
MSENSPPHRTQRRSLHTCHSRPHYPLQCFAKDRDKYRGVYDGGPEVLRQSRLAGLKKEGLISATVQPHDVVSPDNAPWEELTPKEKKFSSRAMEIYAGMVDSMDQHIGRVLDHLEETGQLNNTLVLFFSDNGAEGTALEAEEVVGPHLLETINVSH